CRAKEERLYRPARIPPLSTLPETYERLLNHLLSRVNGAHDSGRVVHEGPPVAPHDRGECSIVVLLHPLHQHAIGFVGDQDTHPGDPTVIGRAASPRRRALAIDGSARTDGRRG